MLSTLYQSVLIQPLLNALVALYNFLGHDIGLAIIALTVIIRLILYPSFKHQLESQKKMTALQPKMNELKEKYKNDKEQQSKALMDLYKEYKVNPFSSCLPTIIQIVVLLAMYKVFLSGLKSESFGLLYPFVNNPGTISTMSFGVFDMSQKNVYLAVITGAVQFVQSKMMIPLQPKSTVTAGQPDISAMMSKQFMYVFPVLTVVIGMQLPAGLAVYWLVTTLFSIGQQYAIMRNKPKENLAVQKS